MTPAGLEQAFREVAGGLSPLPNWVKAFVVFAVHWFVYWKSRRASSVVEVRAK